MILGYNDEEWNKKVKERRKQYIEFECILLLKIFEFLVLDKVFFFIQFSFFDFYIVKIMYVRNGIYKCEFYVILGFYVFRGDDFRLVSIFIV